MLMRIWKNYLSSGMDAAQSDVHSINQIQFINAFSLVGISSTGFFAVMNILYGNLSTGFIEIFFLSIGILNVLYLRKSFNYHLASSLLLIVMLMLLIFLLVGGGFRRTGIFWYFTFPPLAFFLKGIKRGFLHVAVLYALTLSAYELSNLGVIPEIAFRLYEIQQALSSLFAVTLLVYFFEKVRWDSEKRIRINENEILIKNILDIQIKDAGEIQRGFIPDKNYISDHLEVVGNYKPTYEIGGDYFDFFQLDKDRTGIILCDVSSKGIPAALIMVKLRTIVKIYSDLKILKPNELLTTLNTIFEKELMNHLFITSIYLIINKKTGKVQFSSAGHEPLLYYSHKRNKVFAMNEGGLPIGISPDTDLYKNYTFNVDKGDSIILFTDGVIDAMNKSMEKYGQDRLINTIMKSAHQPAVKISENIFTDIMKFSDGSNQADDIAYIVVKIK